VAAGLLANAAAWAEGDADQRIVVTATRIGTQAFDVPASVDRIDADAIGNDRLRLNLSESLGAVPGLSARDRQNYAQDAQLSVRGFGTRSSFGIRGVRLYVDGIPATLPDGQGQLSHIDLGSADRIEVLRGPFSALYGNSSGGVIQVFTEEGMGPPTLSGSVAGGSHGLWRQGLKAAGVQGEMGYVASVSHVETGGTREHAAARREVGNAKLSWRPDADQQLTLVANSVAMPMAQDPLGLTREQFEADPGGAAAPALAFDTRKAMDQTQLGATWQRRLGAHQQLQWMVYAGSRRTEQFQAIPTGPQANPQHPGGVIRLGRDYEGTDLRYTWTHGDDSPFSLVAGLAYDRLDEHRQGYQNFVGSTLGVEGALRRDETNRAANFDPYLQATFNPSAPWRIDAGLRRSTVRISSADHYVTGANGDDSGAVRFSATSPVLSVMYRASEALHLYASAGRGFETPTLNELSYRPDGTAGLNFGLKPAVSRNLELGAKLRLGGRQSLDLAVFEARTTDELVTRSNVGGRASYQNAAATRRRGAELGWQGRFGAAWRAQAALTWLDARYREAFAACTGSPCATPNQTVPAGQRIPGVARGSAYASLDWAPPQGWRGGLELRCSSAVPVNDLGTDAAPAYAVAGLHGGYRMQLGRLQLQAFARLDNLFNRRYAGSVIVNESNGRYFEPAPGRSAFAGLDATIAF
jgi:iron complex outermembrane receptor protein